jgi:hypothetical protein
VKFAKPYEGLATHDRDVERAMLINQLEEPPDELGSLEIADLSQRNAAAEMFIAVSVATGTSEGTFAGNLDRQGRTITAKDSPPRGDNAFHHQTITAARRFRAFGALPVSQAQP